MGYFERHSCYRWLQKQTHVDHFSGPKQVEGCLIGIQKMPPPRLGEIVRFRKEYCYDLDMLLATWSQNGFVHANSVRRIQKSKQVHLGPKPKGLIFPINLGAQEGPYMGSLLAHRLFLCNHRYCHVFSSQLSTDKRWISGLFIFQQQRVSARHSMTSQPLQRWSTVSTVYHTGDCKKQKTVGQ